MKTGLPVVVILAAISAACLPGETITENTGTNNGTDSIWVGQSVTTGGGGPWNNITFNLFDINSAASANGTLYLLTSEYLGTPNDLSAATPGYLASTATIVSGVWEFSNSLTLSANTQYYVYAGLNNILRQNTTGTYGGGIAYQAIGLGDQSFTADSSTDTLFNLSGTPITESGIPEPSTVVLLSAGLLAMLALRR